MNKRILIFIILLMSFAISFAGVFELYGIGKVGLNYSVSAMGRGKSSTGYSDSLSVNLQNPANLAYIRKAGIEMSVHTGHNNIVGTGNTDNTTGFLYGMIKFPLTQKGGFTLGLSPLTSSNASYQILDEVNNYTETASSVGNIYTATLGLGYSFFKKGQLAIGASADYLIGGYNITKEMDFTSNSYSDVLIETDEGFSGWKFTGGINLKPLENLSLGISYSYVTNSSRRQIVNYMTNGSYFYSHIDTVDYFNTSVFPNRLSVGLAFMPIPRYIFTVDWMQYQFADLASDFSFNPFYEGSQILPFNHYGLGFEKQGTLSEYVPFHQSLTYRAGMFYEEQYMANSQGVPVKTYGLTLGLGVPFTKYQNRVDAAFVVEYNTGTIYEQTGIVPINVTEFVYHFNLSITIAENWFGTRGKYR
ncbi:MAG: hypothetical protein U9O95_09330 [Candidatus Marinimicrobia bacterium]|nr:hypothetical protein [Candidatus Neomarinimicrobiota bacterium]